MASDNACPAQAALSSDLIVASVLRHLRPVQRCRLLSVSRAWYRAGDYSDMWDDLTPEQRQASLNAACDAGNLVLARKRVALFGLTPADAISSHALRRACWKGHLALAQWLASHFSITAADADHDMILLGICDPECIAVLQWFIPYYNVSAAIVDENFVLEGVCRCGNLAAAKWLVSYFGLTASHNRDRRCQVLIYTIHQGSLDLVQWLVAYFDMSTADAESCSAVHRAKWLGHFDIAAWLVAHFGPVDDT